MRKSSLIDSTVVPLTERRGGIWLVVEDYFGGFPFVED